jgi:hypothetical protein
LEYDDFPDEDYPPPTSATYSRASSVLPPELSPYYHPNHTDSPSYYVIEGDTDLHMRLRPSPDQIEELRKLYTISSRPTAEERQALAERIGM